jgi:hypothetical protein
MTSPMKPPIRLDKWAAVADAPTAVPREMAPNGSVFRGMADLEEAMLYADSVAKFFAANGYAGPVFVVEGPTTTSRSAYEVVEASCGYRIRYRTQPASVSPVEPAGPTVAPVEPARRRMRA